MAELTPMKRQYLEIKEQYKDCLLFFRLGDFYEMFYEDAITASKALDLALTTRDRNVENPEDRTPMCGIPFHASETYIAKLIAQGYKVAICEQMEDPALAKGLVKRDVIRIITPGTVTESSMLEENRSNYIAAIAIEKNAGGVAFGDVSTGEMCCASFEKDAVGHIINELSRFSPREVVLTSRNEQIERFIAEKINAMTEYREKDNGDRCRLQFVQIDTDSEHALSAVGTLLRYIDETQKFDISHINRLDVFSGGKYMEMDHTTRRNLELTESLHSGEKRGTLLWVLDKTKTPMGSRMMRAWVERPLLSVLAIKRRLTAVDELVHSTVSRSEIVIKLKDISDIQRLVGRCVYGTAGGRDLRTLANCASVLPEIKKLASGFSSNLLREIAEMDTLDDIRGIIDAAIDDAPPFSVREGGIIRKNYNEELDRLRNIRDNGAEMIRALEERERERTGIKKLKIGYNRVFGYYIDVPKSAGDAPIPDDYIRKQTLVSNERYFTQELKELENTLLTAKDQINEMEYNFFTEIREKVASEVKRIQKTADEIAQLDVLCSLAEVAVKNNYTLPEIDTSGSISISEGRHPVVEQTLKEILFVPNDTYLNENSNRVAIVTGPNMAGKSTYMRQTAIIALMAQMGSFVPARSATIGVVDRVFTRIGASDDLASGRSTFMVEMSEMANIIKYATRNSLLILDEIGRGTSTFDGMAIARAVLEYCADKKKLGAKTMFATHYHELSDLEGIVDGVVNYNISAKKQGGTLVFMRKIVRGAADDSYGIEVAKLAGLPETIVKKANEFLAEYEGGQNNTPKISKESDQLSFADLSLERVRKILEGTVVEELTPLEALNLVNELKRIIKN